MAKNVGVLMPDWANVSALGWKGDVIEFLKSVSSSPTVSNPRFCTSYVLLVDDSCGKSGNNN